MKATIGGMQVEGSPAEIAELHRAMQGKGTISAKIVDASELKANVNGSITEAFATRVLNRKPLSDAQREILSELASKHPTRVFFEELQRATGYSKAQLSGALGAFGRRVAATPGFADGMVFLTWDWDENAGSYNYFLTEPAFAAIKRVGL
jgi:predicted transcriptional regulator with HTH domain